MTFRQFQRAIGKRVQKARWDAGLTQLKAAEKANLDERYYRRLEGGEVNPQLDTLFRVARALGRRSSELLDVETPPSGQVPLGEVEAKKPPTGRPPKVRRRK